MTTGSSLPDADVARVQRGRALYEEHGEKIISSYSKGQYKVPSSSGGHHFVKVTSRQEACSCANHMYRRATCAHIIAATMAKAKSAVCEECRKRFRHRDLYEVMESDTYEEGMRLCVGCVAISDVEVA